MYAARYNNLETVKVLLDKGADVSMLDKEGRTPLMYAESYGSPEMVKALRDEEANANMKKIEKDKSKTKKALRLEILRFLFRRPLN